jgi:phenylpropionate dioxygenase-like ring-hydroxylating dioxygenase large terminal subunit
MERDVEMIRNQWYAVLPADELKGRKPIGVTRFGEKLVLWRDSQGKLSCIADRCCHRGASLSLGKVHRDHLACPFHGFEYDATGKVVIIPANGKGNLVPPNFKVDGYCVREAYGFIWLWYGAIRESLPEIPFFEELKSGFAYGEHAENWNVHYSRAIENQLDVVHLPFVHGTTIGRGNKALVNGPVVKWDDTLMTFYVKNTRDQGQAPQKPSEIEDYEELFSLQMQMPNLWQNRVSSRLRIMAAFAPIDEENTRIYLRFYHNFMTARALNQLMDGLGNAANRIVLHQDRRVVITQLPKKSELMGGENLIQGDLPIIEYRRMRQQLKNTAEGII